MLMSCPSCRGTGRVLMHGDPTTFACPDCQGQGRVQSFGYLVRCVASCIGYLLLASLVVGMFWTLWHR